MTTIHIAGPDIRISDHLRQRCGWCGVILCDYDLTNTLVPEGQEGLPATWGTGELVAVDGHVSYVVPLPADLKLPEGSCGLAPPDATH